MFKAEQVCPVKRSNHGSYGFRTYILYYVLP